MTFSSPAYGPGTHVRCDVCRDPEALMEARAGSEVILQAANRVVGTDEATENAVRWNGFVRIGGRLLCGRCAKQPPPPEHAGCAAPQTEEARQALQIQGLARANVGLRAEVGDLKAALRVRESPLREACAAALVCLLDPTCPSAVVARELRRVLRPDA